MEKAFFMAEGLFDIQRVFRQDHPGVIGIQMVAGEESHPAEIDATLLSPMPSPAAPTGIAASA